MAIIKFAILTMIGTVISSIVLVGSELDAAASQNHTSIRNDKLAAVIIGLFIAALAGSTCNISEF